MGIAAAVRSDPALLGAGLRANQVMLAWTLFWLWRAAAVSPRRSAAFLVPLARRRRHPRESTGSGVRCCRPLVAITAASGVSRCHPVRRPRPRWRAATIARRCDRRPRRRASGNDRPLLCRLRTLRHRGRVSQGYSHATCSMIADTDGRSIVLINNPRTVLDDVSNHQHLRETLGTGAGSTRRRCRDAVSEGHGSADRKLAAEFPQLDSLTPERCATCSTTLGSVAHHCRIGGYPRLDRRAQGRHADHDRIGRQSQVVWLRDRERCDVLRRRAVPACAALRGFVHKASSRRASASPNASARNT